MKRDKGFLLILTLVLVGSFWLTFRLNRPPKARGTERDPSQFSAVRAAMHLNTLARKPHPMGTEEHARVRQYIVATMTALGYETQVQESSILVPYADFVTGGRIANVVSWLPGSEGQRAVLVVGHYDSQPNTPGAADDGAAIAAMLEAARALRVSGGLKNDLIFLFSDAEEIGLVGAEAFVREHPLAQKVALVLNLEARGNSGLSFTFETSAENGWIMEEYARAVKYAYAGSVMVEIYRRMPNNTDFTVFRKAGYAGFNAAFVEGFVHYHAMTDKKELLDRGSLQHHGEYIMDIARHFGNLDLSQTKGADRVFFNPVGSWLLVMPEVWQTLMLLSALLMLSLIIVMAVRRQRLNFRSLLGGVVVYPLVMGLCLAVMLLLKTVYGRIYPVSGRYYAQNMPGSGFFLWAFALLSLLIFVGVYRFFSRRFSLEALSLGALIGLTLLALGLFIALPTGAYALLYPLLPPLLFWLLNLWLKRDGQERSPLWDSFLLLSLLPAVFFLSPLVKMMFVVFSMGMLLASVVLLLVLCGILLPWICILNEKAPRLLTVSLFLSILPLLLLGHLHGTPSAAAPMHSNLCYWMDADRGRALWVSRHLHVDRDNERYFPRARVGPLPEFFPQARRSYLHDDAAVVPLPAPFWTPLAESWDDAGRRILSGRLRSARGASVLQLILTSDPALLEMDVEGTPVTLPPLDAAPLTLSYHNLPPEGIALRLVLAPGSQYEMVMLDLSWGLPDLPQVRPLPPEVIPDTAFFSRGTLVKKTISF